MPGRVLETPYRAGLSNREDYSSPFYPKKENGTMKPCACGRLLGPFYLQSGVCDVCTLMQGVEARDRFIDAQKQEQTQLTPLSEIIPTVMAALPVFVDGAA